MKRRKIPEAFHPGEYLKDELKERRWSVAKLARKIGSPVSTIDQIIAGGRVISPAMAERLGKALGTGAEVWLNLQNAYNSIKKIRSARRGEDEKRS